MSAYGSSFGLLDDLDRLLSEPHTIVVPEPVLRELSSLSKGCGRSAVAARVGLKLAARFQSVPIEGPADEAVARLAEQCGKRAIVCTNDAHLKNILKDVGIRVVGVRDRSHLDFL